MKKLLIPLVIVITIVAAFGAGWYFKGSPITNTNQSPTLNQNSKVLEGPNKLFSIYTNSECKGQFTLGVATPINEGKWGTQYILSYTSPGKASEYIGPITVQTSQQYNATTDESPGKPKIAFMSGNYIIGSWINEVDDLGQKRQTTELSCEFSIKP